MLAAAWGFNVVGATGNDAMAWGFNVAASTPPPSGGGLVNAPFSLGIGGLGIYGT